MLLLLLVARAVPVAPAACVTVARTRRQNALDASTAPLYYYHDRVQHRYTRPPLRPSRPDLRPHRDSNQRPPTHGPPCRTHGQEFWTLTGLELATCGSVPKTHATSRPLHYCVANLAPNQDVTVARTRRQNALDASTAPLYYYHDRVQHRYSMTGPSWAAAPHHHHPLPCSWLLHLMLPLQMP